MNMAKKYGLYFRGELCEGVSHPLRSREGTNERARARITTENEKDIIKVYVYSLPLSLCYRDIVFLSVLLKRSTQLILSFSLFDDY